MPPPTLLPDPSDPLIPMIKPTTAAGPPSTSPRTSCFLGCFGFSGDKNIIMQPVDKVINSTTTTRRRSRRWIPKWSFGCKEPLNDVVAPAKPVKKWEIQVVEEDPALTKKLTRKITVEEQEQKPGRKKWADVVRRENGSLGSRRKETKPAATSAAGAGRESPGEKSQKTVTMIAKPCVSSPLKPLTQSKPLPAPPKKQMVVPKPPTTAGGGVDDGVLAKTTPSGGEFDSVIAMAILLAILVIMLLWGKLCAIFFTCAWFLVVAAGKRSAVATAEVRPPESQNKKLNLESEEYKKNKLNLESEEYKKKVVLEGLLQRNHRNNVAAKIGPKGG